MNAYPKVCKWLSAIAFVLTLAVVGGLNWSYVTEVLLWPDSDAKSCFDIAIRFFNSEFNAVVPEGSYLSLWPFQTGFIFILEKCMRIFQNTTPLFFQRINCSYILLIIASGYGIVCSFTKKIEARIVYLFLMATYFPLFFCVTEVYGDVPGLAWMMVSSLCFILIYKTEKKWQKNILAFVFASATIIACTYKRNCLIYVISILLVSFVLQLRKWQRGFLTVVLITVILSVFSTKITQKYYEAYAGNTCGKGVPAIAYIAMGLQYNGEEAIPGGWNGFHSNTYMETGYDYDETVKLSIESIKDSIKIFSEDMGFMLRFFHNKVLKQWANQTHGAYWGLNGYYDVTRNADDFWVVYLERSQYQDLLFYEDVHESIMYGILFLACCLLLKNKIKKYHVPFHYHVPFVAFIGGFLFSLIWEGQTGAVMYYPILALPVAIGLLSSVVYTECTG